jgi:serine/threonine-protein kinase
MDSVLEELRSALADRYQVDALIGRGGMATVYSAVDLKHDRKVAIKVLSPDLAATIGAERFAREIKIAARLTHPNILTVFDSGTIDDLLYYVMPFVDGESLRARLDRESQISVDDTIQIACEVADALSYAHSAGIVHRDIKPENILLQNQRVLVADFGIARAVEQHTGERLTGTGVLVGTAAYMSPEQAAGDTIDVRSDIYALGCTVYEMLAGSPPFTGPNAMAVMARHTLDPVPSLRTVRPGCPVELEAAIMRAMEKAPADRWQTMDDFKRAVLGEAPATMTTTRRFTARYRTTEAVPRAPSVWRRTAIVGATLVGVGGIGAFVATKLHARGAAAASDANRIAVTYFDDMSGGTLRHVADGLTENLIDQLRQIPALDVVSAGGVRPYRGRDVAADSIARSLHVGSIVKGTLDPDPKGARLTITLLDASNADVAHTSVPIDTAHIVSLQGEVARDVVDFLRKRIGTEVNLRDDRLESTSDAAWTAMERAQKLRKDADSLAAAGAIDSAWVRLTSADSLLGVATTADPTWAKAYAVRALTARSRAQVLAALKQPLRLVPVVDSGLAYVDQALHLQPSDADAFEARGHLQYLLYKAHAIADPRVASRLPVDAESSFTRAVSINKNQAGAWVGLSRVDYDKPNIQAANLAARNAYQADAYLSSANEIINRLFWTSHDLESFPEALKWCDEGHRRFPADPFYTECRLWMYTTPLQQPNLDSVWTYEQRYIAMFAPKMRPYKTKFAEVLVGGALARAGLADSARHVLDRAHPTPSEDPSREIEGYEAVMRVMIGTPADKDAAVRLIEDYLTVNPEHRAGFAKRITWWWRPIQENPRFKALIAGAR